MVGISRAFLSSIPALLLFCGLLAWSVAHAAERREAPVVVELFTSQGCSSCPAADAFLGELAMRDDVLPLSIHVDYWNYIGWADPFATEYNTARQKAYMHALGTSYVYTPQMVINGERHVVGSNRTAVDEAISAARDTPGPHVRVALTAESNGKVHVMIPASAVAEPASILLVLFDKEHETSVTAGENTGREIANYNVVRGFAKLGEYRGKLTNLVIAPDQVTPPLSVSDGCAVLLQSDRSGAIVGAGMMWLEPA